MADRARAEVTNTAAEDLEIMVGSFLTAWENAG
jgi:hypothetical protein